MLGSLRRNLNDFEKQIHNILNMLMLFMGRGSFVPTSFFSWLIYWGMGEDLRE